MGARIGGVRPRGTLSARTSEPSALRRLVLLGSGIAHAQLLRRLARSPIRGLEVVLIADEHELYHPALTAGLLRGDYTRADAYVDVAALADRAGVRVARGPVERLVLEPRVAQTPSERIAYDVCSLDFTGSAEGHDIPGVREHAFVLRPAAMLDVGRSIDERLARTAMASHCVVVGAGPTGVECAFSMLSKLRAAKREHLVTIVDGATSILPGRDDCREPARVALEREGVCFALGARVIEVRRGELVLSSGATLPADIVLWATGGRGPGLIAASALPHDSLGRLLVDDRLRARDGAPVWAVGDCGATAHPGAARTSRWQHGLLLDSELRAALGVGGSRPAPKHPSDLCLLDTGDGRALVRWRGWDARTRWAGWLKRRRDRRAVSDLMQP